MTDKFDERMVIYTVDSGTRSRQAEMLRLGYGVLLMPGGGVRSYHKKVKHIAVDNGAYRNWIKRKEPNFALLFALLDKIKKAELDIDFVVTPDIVAGGKQSLELSIFWSSPGTLLSGWPLYLAVQDGMSVDDVKPYLSRFKGIFVGGSLEWKMYTAANWIELARRHHLKCHIGRCGTINRLKWAYDIGANSVDSSSLLRNDKLWYAEDFLDKKQIELIKGLGHG